MIFKLTVEIALGFLTRLLVTSVCGKSTCDECHPALTIKTEGKSLLHAFPLHFLCYCICGAHQLFFLAGLHEFGPRQHPNLNQITSGNLSGPDDLLVSL